MADHETAVVAARPSASVVIVRPGPRGPELLMVKRRAGDVFGDSYAFPGGLVDDDEPKAHKYCRGTTPEKANTMLHVAEGGLNFYSAAIRELFEETGILLARDGGGNWASESPDLHEFREQVDTGILPWPDFLERQGLTMACDALHYFAHWETPLIQAKRWSARFFFAEMPNEQDVRHASRELTDSLWITAIEALSASRQGEMKLPFPTIRNLRTFADIDSVDGLIHWADERALAGVQKTRPARFEKDGRWKWTIPGDPDYPGE